MNLFMACVAMMLVTNSDDPTYDLASALAGVDACLWEERIEVLYERLDRDMQRLVPL